MGKRTTLTSIEDVAGHTPPHPIRRAVIGLALGLLLGLFVALIQPRPPASGDES